MRGESYLFQKYMMRGKRDMIAPWKMFRSRWPSVMAPMMESFWDSEMFTYPQNGSLSVVEAPAKAENLSWPPGPLRPPSPEGGSCLWGC